LNNKFSGAFSARQFNQGEKVHALFQAHGIKAVFAVVGLNLFADQLPARKIGDHEVACLCLNGKRQGGKPAEWVGKGNGFGSRLALPLLLHC
jgi:hypothetical protein